MIYGVGDCGAAGVARPAETLDREFLQFKWLKYPAHTSHERFKIDPEDGNAHPEDPTVWSPLSFEE